MAEIDKLTQDTLDAIKSATIKKASSVTVSTGLVPYSLEAPAKYLVPTNTPIRNRLKRVQGMGDAAHWKAITGVQGSGYDGMGFVPEGQRTGAIGLTTVTKTAAFRTIGDEASISYEALNAAVGFEDVKARMSLTTLQKVMLKEENALIGGNASISLGTTPTPTLSAGGSGATLPNATYSVICVAMTFEGYRNYNGVLSTGLVQSKTINGQDGNSYVLNGGYGQKSTNATQAITLGQTLSASVTPVSGAMAYAWYVGTAGSEKLEKVTTINSVTFSAPLTGTGQLASALASTDYSNNSSLAFDGFLYSAFNSSGASYINTLATGTAGTGTTLTASGRGSVVEIDTMFLNMWNNYQVSPSVLYVNSQELNNITNKVLTGGSGAPLVRFNMDGTGGQPLAPTAGAVVGSYYNPFTTDNSKKIIPIELHPALPAGTILAWADNLPVQYQSNEVPDVAVVKTRKDYYQLDYPQVTREVRMGVYSEEVFICYFPAAIGIINNIANG